MNPQQSNEQQQPTPQPSLAPESPADPLSSAPQQPNLQSYPMPPKKSKGMLIAIIVAVVLVVAGAVVAVLLLTKSKHDNSKTTSQNNSQNTSTNDVLEAQAYEMPTAHISIRPPKNWKATPSPDPSEPGVVVEFTLAGSDGNPAVGLNITYADEKITANEDLSLDSIETALVGEGTKTNSEDVKVDGVPGRLVEFSTTNQNDVKVQVMAVIVIKGKRAWSIACAAKPAQYVTYKEDCRQSMLSLKFLN